MRRLYLPDSTKYFRSLQEKGSIISHNTTRNVFRVMIYSLSFIELTTQRDVLY
jgi:hypothetical protein